MVRRRPAALEGATSPGTALWSRLLRVAVHLAAWLPFLYGLIRALALGWVPTSDNAGIALRSWDVLSAQGPLLGQATRLATGVYDPGPLQYWLQTVPIHLDPAHGVLWGAALWCMLACSLTIEAAWSVAGWLGGLLACGITLGAVAWISQIAVLPCWNPWFGLMFFIAALAAAFAVMSGHRGWWPVLAFTGSVAAQAHLMFTIAAALLVVLAFIVGVVGSIRARKGYWWAVIGLLVGLACWSAPVIQQFTSPAGNLGALLSGKDQLGSPAGAGFGFRAISAATQPPAYWWTPVRELGKLSLIDARTPGFGIAALAVTALILVVSAYPLRSAWLAALATVSLVISIAAVITYSRVPQASVAMTTSTTDNLRYLMAPMYPAGMLIWLTACSAVVLIASRAVTAAARRSRGGAAEPAQPRRTGAWAARIRIAVAAVLIVLTATVAVTETGQAANIRDSVMAAVGPVTQQIRQRVPGHQLVLSVSASSIRLRRQLIFGLAYALRTVGYQPEITNFQSWALQLGPQYLISGTSMPQVTVYLHPTGTFYVKLSKTAP